MPEYTQLLSFITLKKTAGVLSVESSLGAGPLSAVEGGASLVAAVDASDEDEDSEEEEAESLGGSSEVFLVLRLLLRRERERESSNRKNRRWRNFILVEKVVIKIINE